MLCLLALASPIYAEDFCDTLVVPPGVGIGGPADVTSMNGLLADNFYDQEVYGLLYQGLIMVDAQDRLDLPHSIASKIEVFDNGARYRVTMRPWLWSDGKPVTSDDVLFTWELIQKLGSTYVNAGSGGVPDLIASVTALGPEQIEVRLKRPVNSLWFEFNGLGQFEPLPRHVWGELSADQIWEDQSDPAYFRVVDGPFAVEKFALGRSISFTRNPLYPLEQAPFKRLVLKFLNSNGAELQGVESGELDLANMPHEASGAKITGDVKEVAVPPGFGYGEMGINFKSPDAPFFRDKAVRQAIQDSIDQDKMIDKLWHGQGVANYGPVPVQPDSFLSPSAKAGHYPIGFDLAHAKALLDQAGYLPGPDGIRQKNGVRLEFTLMTPAGTATSLMMAQMMQPDLRASGILMHIKQLDYSQMMSALFRHSANWQAYMLVQQTGTYPSADNMFNTGGVYNFGGYSDPKMDQLINDSTNKPGLDALYQYQDYASDQLPVIFMPESSGMVLTRPYIGGLDRLITPGGGFNPQLLTINQEACHAAHVVNAR